MVLLPRSPTMDYHGTGVRRGCRLENATCIGWWRSATLNGDRRRSRGITKRKAARLWRRHRWLRSLGVWDVLVEWWSLPPLSQRFRCLQDPSQCIADAAVLSLGFFRAIGCQNLGSMGSCRAYASDGQATLPPVLTLWRHRLATSLGASREKWWNFLIRLTAVPGVRQIPVDVVSTVWVRRFAIGQQEIQ